MSYLALYRRYRPKKFEDLIGQEHIVKTLVNQIENDRLGHAYLFTGTRGTGKTTAAKIFAKAINCLHPVNGSPCGECEVCKALSDPSNIDVIEIDAASNNGVNEIRELRDNVQFPPVSCKYKVYIVDEVHMLTGAAFNALLKTLEEPPKHAVFILATTEVHKIPATILSRCMRFDFRLVSAEKIAELISKIYDEQGKGYEKEGVFAIAKAGEGSVRDALSIADIALSFGTGKLTYEDVTEILGSTNFELISDFVSSVIGGNTGRVLETIDGLSSLGKSMGVLIKDVTATLRDLLVINTCRNPNGILGLPENKFQSLSKIAETATEEKLLRAMEIFSNAESLLKYSTHPRVVFETAAVKATRPETDFSIEALLDRISALEKGAVKVKQTVSEPIPFSKTETPKVEETPKTAEISVSPKIKVEEMTSEAVKGKLLSGLNNCGYVMLWNAMQNVDVELDGSTVYILPKDDADRSLLGSGDNLIKLKEALKDCDFSDLQLKEERSKRSDEEVDDATENIKKIFGDDIVIVKP